MTTPTVGVIVARFQTPELHNGHRYLLEEVCRRHADVLVVLGRTRARPDIENALSFELREMMVRSVCPSARVRPLDNNRSDEEWSRQLDALIAAEWPDREAVLYGSRRCFLTSYTGKHAVEELPPIDDSNATRVRQAIATTPIDSADFRAGVIYGEVRPPRVYKTVDIAIIRERDNAVLLGGRNADGGKLRFIGGFVDPTDPSLEMAAKREAVEEAGDIEIDALRYLGSTLVDDWRYRNTSDRVMTSLFVATFIFGRATAKDDIDRVEWVPAANVAAVIVDEHKPLVAMLEKYLASKEPPTDEMN